MPVIIGRRELIVALGGATVGPLYARAQGQGGNMPCYIKPLKKQYLSDFLQPVADQFSSLHAIVFRCVSVLRKTRSLLTRGLREGGRGRRKKCGP